MQIKKLKVKQGRMTLFAVLIQVVLKVVGK